MTFEEITLEPKEVYVSVPNNGRKFVIMEADEHIVRYYDVYEDGEIVIRSSSVIAFKLDIQFGYLVKKEA